MCISVKEAMSAPFLDASAERQTLQAWQGHRDPNAAEVILRSHARLVLSIVQRWKRAGLEPDDLTSAGMQGLLVAAERFDLERDVRFSTYARWWVRTAIQSEAARLRSLISVPDKALRELKREAKAGQSESSGMNAATARFSEHAIDIDGLHLAERVPSDEPSPEDALVFSEQAAHRKEALHAAIETLPDPARSIMFWRSQPEPRSCRDIAGELNLTETQVHAIQDNAHLRLRRVLIERGQTPRTLW